MRPPRGPAPVLSACFLKGNTSAEATNGKASFGPLRIKETSNAPSGPYQICVTAEGVRPLLIPFAFSNDTVKTMMHSRLTDKRQDVESAIQTMQDQLQGVRTKCAALEKESEKKLRQVQQLRKSMDVKNANWENFNPAALVLLCNQQMQALTYNEKVRRSECDLCTRRCAFKTQSIALSAGESPRNSPPTPT